MWRASPRHSIHSVPCATRSQQSTLTSSRLIAWVIVGVNDLKRPSRLEEHVRTIVNGIVYP